ncbi:MAG: transglutaminase domain-containing protein [Thermoguttaceae bacterium]
MNRFFFALARITFFGWWMLVGCNGNSEAAPVADLSQRPTQTAAAHSEQAADSSGREWWEVYRMQGKRIGYGRTTVRDAREADRPIVRVESLNHMAANRAGQTATQDIQTTSVETPDGQLLRFETEVRMGQKPIRTTGQVRGERLDMETRADANVATRESIAWPAGSGGPLAMEQSLGRKPMQPGQRRTVGTLMIGLNQRGDVEMNAKGWEPTDLPGGKRTLLRIDTVTRLADGQTIEGTIWTDRDGETLKTTCPMMGLEVYRATKAEALAGSDTADLDLLPSMLVPLDRPLKDAHHTRRVRYLVQLDNGDPARSLAVGPSQAVRSIDAHTAEVTVYSVRPGRRFEGNDAAADDRPTDDDLTPNNYIESDDPQIVADAKAVAGDRRDPWTVAVALERFVHDSIRRKDFSQAFATAAEVARSHEGDCTEHAVLLAALCRACGIPARVAFGLVYMEGGQAFGYHMWTEVYIDRRWIPIDGTLALGGIGAAHLKIAHTNLKGASAYSAMLPVVKMLGHLKIRVTDVP